MSDRFTMLVDAGCRHIRTDEPLFTMSADDEVQAAVNAIHLAIKASADTAPHGGAESILMVEDDDALRAYTIEILKEPGYRVLEAVDGAAAVTGRDDCRAPPSAVPEGRRGNNTCLARLA